MSAIKTVINRNTLQKVRMAKPNWSDSGVEQQVYRVNIKELHYNEENGRIATWISTYLSDGNNPKLDTLSREEFNNIIEGFIKKANKKEALDALMLDIKKKTQLNPGVILTDGTIVSGNRRFTALRNLYEIDHDEKYEYFECFVIDAPDTKEKLEFVKLIETKTQFSVVSEEDYNSIDRLVTIYRYLIDEETKIWSIKDYAKKIGIKEREAENLYYRAMIMVDYLEYINKPKAFHIARIDKLDGPIAELPGLYKDLNDTIDGKREWKRIRPLFYSEFPPKKSKDDSKDRTRKVRSFKNMYTKNRPEFERLLLKLYEVAEKIEERNRLGLTAHSEFRTDESGREQALTSLDSQDIENAVHATNKLQAREKQITKAGNALKTLNEIDYDVFPYMDEEDKDRLNSSLDELITKINEIKNKLQK